MHEMSIIESLLDAVRAELVKYPGAQVTVVRVRVGALRLVVPEVLQLCYAAAIRGTPWEGSRLELETVAATARCRQCGNQFAVEEQWFECPSCGAFGAELLSGQELDLVNIELEENGVVATA